MINKPLYLFVGLLMIGGLFSPTRALAFNPPPVPESLPLEDESLPQTRYWNIMAEHLAGQIIANGRLGSNTLYVDENPAASEITQYLEQELSEALKESGARVSVPTRARYAIELDVNMRERSDGHGTAYAAGGDIDQLLMIRELEAIYPGQRAYYEMIPLTANQPISINSLAGTDTEMLITVRIMERGWIHRSYTYAFYFTEALNPENRFQNDEGLKDEKESDPDVFMVFQNNHSDFLDYQIELDKDVEQLLNSYGF